MCYWKQWRLCRTKVVNLLKLGVGLRSAILTGVSSKSYWHLARTPATQQGMSNAWLKAQGLISIRDEWMKAQGYLKGKRVRPVIEPPGARPACRVVWGLEVRDLRLPD